MQFEYLVCHQYSRVTFANGKWQGSVALNSGDSQARSIHVRRFGIISLKPDARAGS